MKVVRVYVAHPLRGDVVGNMGSVERICKMIEAMDSIMPVSPLHAFSFVDPLGDQGKVLRWCRELLSLCDEVWVFGEDLAVEQSEGVQLEIGWARELGIPMVRK